MRNRIVLLMTVLAAAPAAAGAGVAYTLPPLDQAVIGETRTIQVRDGQSLPDLARAHGLGFDEIKLANPAVDTWLPGAGTEVVLPLHHVLPDAPREGIVVNIPEMRIYWYPPAASAGARRVVTYPVSVGRLDWQTPLGATRVVRKDRDPAWLPPESIRREHAARGEFLPKRIPPGPDNPLGRFALRLGVPGYLIHGTNKPYGIGMQVTHGCLRLYPEDIEELFSHVEVGTPVHIVDQPYKVGRHLDDLYLEVHPPMTDGSRVVSLTPLVEAVRKAREAGPTREVDWDLVYRIADQQSGIPVRITIGS